MKSFMAFLSALVFAGSLSAQAPAADSGSVGERQVLGTAAGYLDAVYANAQASLALVAQTPEAARGDWPGIKRYLSRLKAELPGVYFYVLPDGNYYSVQKDYTRLNLGNRAYFKPLFEGKTVMGYPIYSRSTGKRSALVAVPISVKGKVVGALGISVFLDDLGAKLDRAMALPENYTWYVLNEQGDTMLDKQSDFIFMNALKQGSTSLRDAVNEALKHDNGTVQYELDNRRTGSYQKLRQLPWRMFLVRVEGKTAPLPPKLTLSLERFVPLLQQNLDAIDVAVAEAAQNPRVDPANEAQVRKLLRSVLKQTPYAVNAGFVDTKGTLRYLEPGDYKNFEKSDISTQVHIKAMLADPHPLLSAGFETVEDFTGVVIARPLYDTQKRFVGAVTVLVRPELFIAPLIKKSAVPEDYELWIMQPEDGLILYDEDRAEIGKKLFSDPIYAGYGNLLTLGRQIAAQPSGEGDYIYLAPGSQQKVIKKARWESVGLHGREWRVVLAYRPYK